jgi:CBS-domain-containing membrane protein
LTTDNFLIGDDVMSKETIPNKIRFSEILWSWVGAFLGISLLSYLHFNIVTELDHVLLIGSFGASAVLIYGAISSPLAQPRNLLGGHMFSAFIGVTSYRLFPGQLWFASAFSVATAIAVMQLTRTVHPPGGASALIAVIGSERIHSLGYWYVFVPVGVGALIMLCVALIVNKVANRKYPV